MASLYDIDTRLYSLLDEETGEITDIEAFEKIQLEREDKIESIALWVKNLKADAEALKAEKLAFAERQKAAEKKIDSLKHLLSDALGGQNFKTARVALSFRKSSEVQIDDIEELSDEYLRYKAPEPDKAAIKAAINEGKKVAGAKLVSKINLQIK
jgi:hypothetical protein